MSLEKQYVAVIDAGTQSIRATIIDLNGNICEIELSLPGPKIFASSKEKNFELAAKNTVADLTKQLKKRKATFNHH